VSAVAYALSLRFSAPFGIFYKDCHRNGIVPVELPLDHVRRIVDEVEATGGAGQVTVNLETQIVTSPSGARYAFTAQETLRQMRMQGVGRRVCSHAGAARANRQLSRSRPLSDAEVSKNSDDVMSRNTNDEWAVE
jgi:3-isopropylmalate dehydratase small subunit